MRYLLIILLLSSCSAQYHIKKAQQKGALIKTDTVYQDVLTERTITDTLVQVKDHFLSDTITVETLRWRTKTKIDTVLKTVYQQVECKPDTVRVPVAINTEVDCPACKGLKRWQVILLSIGIFLLAFVLGYIIRKLLG